MDKKALVFWKVKQWGDETPKPNQPYPTRFRIFSMIWACRKMGTL